MRDIRFERVEDSSSDDTEATGGKRRRRGLRRRPRQPKKRRKTLPLRKRKPAACRQQAEPDSLSERDDACELTFTLSPNVDGLPFHTTTTVAGENERLSSREPRVFRLLRLSDSESDSEDSEPPPRRPLTERRARKANDKQEQPARKANDKKVRKCARLEPLTANESRVLTRAVAAGTVVDGQGYTLRGEDFERLVAPSEWLNDTVVDAYTKLINARNASFFASTSLVTTHPVAPATTDKTRTPSPETPAAGVALHPVPSPPTVGCVRRRTRTYAFGSFFFKLLCPTRARYTYEAVRSWTTGPLVKCSNATRERGKVEVLDYQQILVPVNVGGSHWVLAVVDLADKEFVFMDSLRCGDGARGVIRTLRRWLADEVTEKYGAEVMRALDIGSWETVENPAGMPRQTDSDSCGMFCLALAERRELGRTPDFTQGDMAVLRKRAALALYAGALAQT